MAELSGKRKRDEFEEAIPLADLMDADGELDADYEVIEEETPKRKRKPKPQERMQMQVWIVVGIALLLIAIGLGLVVTVTPVSESVVVSQPIEQVVAAGPHQGVGSTDPFVDRWLMLKQAGANIPADTFVRVLSQDNTPEYYNVADLEGNMTIVLGTDLVEAAGAPSASVYPPLGPYAAALSSSQKLLVTVESNGDLQPGTAVYAMGWRAEDGTWIYEVSPDRVNVYYLPALHLQWADSVSR